jgi:hypothetical protein
MLSWLEGNASGSSDELKESVAVRVGIAWVEASVGVKTSQMKPTSRPDAHSCRNAIMSQKSSSDVMLFHMAVPFLEGDECD